MRYATAKIEKLEKDLKESKASEKAKDKEVDEAWTKMRFALDLALLFPFQYLEMFNGPINIYLCQFLSTLIKVAIFAESIQCAHYRVLHPYCTQYFTFIAPGEQRDFKD